MHNYVICKCICNCIYTFILLVISARIALGSLDHVVNFCRNNIKPSKSAIICCKKSIYRGFTQSHSRFGETAGIQCAFLLCWFYLKQEFERFYTGIKLTWTISQSCQFSLEKGILRTK